ncbi:MAG: ferredoxin [Deltaproteobacteria bacterium]|nr:ferredoxin [Deltaproteobacteria bacterium]
MGINPFIKSAAPPLPTRPYTLRLVNTGQEFRVEPEDLPTHEEGHVGSVLSILLHHGVELDHTCGGVCACSTCHVYVRSGIESTNEPIEEEEDQLDFAPALEDDSRLACQCVPDGSQTIEVEIPAWTRNEVSEEH